MTTATRSAQRRLTLAFHILRNLHGDIAGLLNQLEDLSQDTDVDPGYLESNIAEASQLRPGLDLLLDPSILDQLDTVEAKTTRILEALHAQPQWEAATIFAFADGRDKTVTQTDHGFITSVAYVGGDDAHVQHIHTDHHPTMNISAALAIAGFSERPS